MKLILSPRAVRRLHEIQTYITQDNPYAAMRMIARIRQTMEMLAENPRFGRPWQGGHLSFPVSGTAYRIHYRLNEKHDVLEVLTVTHSSRKPRKIS